MRETASSRSAWISGSEESSVWSRLPACSIRSFAGMFAAGLLGVGDLEEADQELLDPVGAQGLGGGLPGVDARALRLPGRAGEAGDERQEDQRGGRDPGAVARMNLPAR